MPDIFDQIDAKPSEEKKSGDIFDQISSEPKDETPSVAGSFAREAGRSVIPGVAGIAGGFIAGGAAGLAGGPLAPITVPLAALGGGIYAGMKAREYEDELADEYVPDSFMGTKSAQADAEAHPIATFAGSLVGMGKPSASALSGAVKAVGTQAGRKGIGTIAKQIGSKEARDAVTRATTETIEVEGAKTLTPAAIKALEAQNVAAGHFGHALGGAAGVGAMTGMGIAEGEDPGTAALKGVFGLAVKPWVGPGGVFLDPFKAKGGKQESRNKISEKPEAEAEETITGTSEEILGKAESNLSEAEATVSKAADVAEKSDASATAEALRETLSAPAVKTQADVENPLKPAFTGSATPEVSRVDDTATQLELPLNETQGVAGTQSADPAQLELPFNETQDRDAQAPQQPGVSADPTGENLATGGEVSPQAKVAAGQPPVVEQPPQGASAATEIPVAEPPVAEAPAPAQPAVTTLDGEKALSAEDYRGENRPITAKLTTDSQKSPSIKTLATQAEQAGDLAKLNELLLETRVRANAPGTKNKKAPAALADEIRQRIARVKAGEPAPAEAPTASETPAQPAMTVDELDGLGDLLLGGGDLGEITAQAPATKAASKEDPRTSLKRTLGLSAKGAALIRNGAQDFETWSQQMVAQFGEVRNLKDVWDYSNEYLQNPQLAKNELAHIERWTTDPRELELRMLDGDKIVIPRQVDMDDAAQFNPKFGFEYDPELKEMVVRPKNFDPVIEAAKVAPKGENGNYSYQQIANFLNKYFTKEGIKNAEGKILRTDKATVGTQVKPDAGTARAEEPMPTDRLENALRWYKRNVENRSVADNIYSQTSRLSTDAILKESVGDLNTARASLPADKLKEFDSLITQVHNFLTTKLGGVIERKLTAAQEAARKVENRLTVEGEMAAQERKVEAREKAEREGIIEEEPALPSGKKSKDRDVDGEELEDYELYEQPEGKEGKGVSRLRRYSVDPSFRGFDDIELEAMRYFTLSRTMSKIAAEMRGDPGANGLTKFKVKGLQSAVGNDDLIQAREEIRRIRNRRKTGGVETLSANAKRGDTDEEYIDIITESGLNPADSDESFRTQEKRGLMDQEDLSPEERLKENRDRGLEMLASENLSTSDRVALVHALIDAKALSREEMGVFANEFRKIPADQLAPALEESSYLLDSFSLEDLLDGKHKTQELGAKSTRLAKLRSEGEVPVDPDKLVQEYAEILFPGIEFYADRDLNESRPADSAVATMEAWIRRADSTFGVRYDPESIAAQMRGMTPEQARKFLLKTMEEEALHISSIIGADGKIDRSAMARARFLGMKLSPEQKYRVAEFYMGEGASMEQMDAFVSDSLTLGLEYTRMMHQWMRTGRSTEVLREAQANPSLFDSLMGYIQNAMRWVEARLKQGTNKVLRRQLSFMSQNYSRLANSLRGVSSNPDSRSIFIRAALQKAKKLGLDQNPTARLFTERYEKKIDWNRVKTPEQLEVETQKVVAQTQDKLQMSPEDMAAIMAAEAEANKDNAGEGGDAARRFLTADGESQKAQAETLAEKVTEDRVKNYTRWNEYLTSGNEEYAKDPYWRALVHEMLYNALSSGRAYGAGETLPLNPGVLAKVRAEVERLPGNQNLDILKLYRKGLAEDAINSAYDNVPATGDRKWVYIPSRSEDPQNFDANVGKLQSLSHDRWCTKTYNAEPYLKQGGFWILTHGERPAAAIRLFDGGKIAEIQGKANNGTIPEEYGQDIKTLLDARKEQLKNYDRFEIKNPATSEERLTEIAVNLVKNNPEFSRDDLPFPDESQFVGFDQIWEIINSLGSQNKKAFKALVDLDNQYTDYYLSYTGHLPKEARRTLLDRALYSRKHNSYIREKMIEALASNYHDLDASATGLGAEDNRRIWDYVKDNEEYNSADRMAMASRLDSGKAELDASTRAEVDAILVKKPVGQTKRRSGGIPSDEEGLDEFTFLSPATKVKRTTALDEPIKTFSPELQKALKDVSYMPFKWKGDAEQVSKWLNDSASSSGATWEKIALDLTSEEPVAGISDRQKMVGKFMLTKSLDNAATEFKKAGKIYEAARYNKLAKTLFKATKLDASAYGQGLNSVRMLTELVSGNTSLSQYIDPIAKVHHEKLSGRAEVADILGTLKGGREAAADSTLTKAASLLKKLAGGKDLTEINPIVREALLHPDSTLESLTAEIAAATGVSPVKAAPVAEAIRNAFTLEARKASRAELDKLVGRAKTREDRDKVKKVVESDAEKLLKLVGMGAFSEEKYYNAIAKTYGLPSWDPTFAKFVEKEGEKINALPKSMKDYRQQKTQRLMGEIAKKLRAEKLNNKDVGEIADLLTTFWQLGVLSGPPTQVVNAVASGASVVGESLVEATGAALKTGDTKHIAEVFSGFLQAFTGKGGAKGLAGQEFSRAFKEGTSKYKNSKGETLSSMETLPDAEDLQGIMKLFSVYGNKLKYVGRSMAAFDSANMAMAELAAERRATRYYLQTEKGLKGEKLESALKDLFDPESGTVDKLRAQAKQEVKDGNYADETPADQNRWVERRVNELLSQRRDELTGGGISESAIQAAERFTYNDDARGILGQFAGFMNQINQETKVSKFVISFMKTMMNLVNQTVDWSPYGYLRGANKSFSQTRFKEGSRFDPYRYTDGSTEQYAQYARATIGTMAWAGLAYLASKGLEEEREGKAPVFSIHGSGPSNSYDKQQLLATRNWQPNSIRIGGHWLRYKDWPILGMALGGMGSFFDSLRYAKDESTTSEKLFAGAMATASTVLDKNMLQGVSNLFEGISQSSNSTQQANALKHLISGAVGGFTNPGMAKWARNSFFADKDGMVNRLDQSTLEGWAYSMVPFSIGYNTPALNTLGEPLQQPWYSATMWRFADVSGAPPHPIITPLVKSGLMLPNPSKNTEFRYQDKTGALQKSKVGKFPEINRRFVELRGRVMKEMLTPEVIGDLSRMAKQENLNEVQSYLDSRVGGAARQYAISQIEQEIQDGKLRLD